MARYSSVPCTERMGSRTETLERGTMSCSVVLECPWNFRYSLILDVVGGRRVWPYQISTGTDFPPRAYRASCQPFPSQYVQEDQGMRYDVAVITVEYSSDDDVQLISESLEPTATFMTLDSKQFRWGSGSGAPLQEEEAPGRLLKGMNIVRQIYQWRAPLPTALKTLVGSVNDAVYNSALIGLSFEAETLLFEPPTISRSISASGFGAYDVSMKLQYKEEGWNKFWRAESESYERIYKVGSADPYYNHPLASFAPILIDNVPE